MIIGLLSVEIFLPFSHSLKEKRRILKSLKTPIRRHNVAVAELDYQDKWQRAVIGVVTINSQKAVVETMLNKILSEAETHGESQILNHGIQFF